MRRGEDGIPVSQRGQEMARDAHKLLENRGRLWGGQGTGRRIAQGIWNPNAGTPAHEGSCLQQSLEVSKVVAAQRETCKMGWKCRNQTILLFEKNLFCPFGNGERVYIFFSRIPATTAQLDLAGNKRIKKILAR